MTRSLSSGAHQGGNTMTPHRSDNDRLILVPDDPMNSGWWEAKCAECGEPLRWILDMWSFRIAHARVEAVHARCAWTAEAFTNEAKRAAREARKRNEPARPAPTRMS